MFEMIAFDADDTLWHNEPLYRRAREQFIHLLAADAVPAAQSELEEKMAALEIGNLPDYGYGIKSYTLTLVEAAIRFSDGQISPQTILAALELGKTMHRTAVELFAHSEETLAALAQQRPLMMLTKGDTFEQERKIKRSGLARYFRYIEVMGEKEDENYRTLLERYRIPPDRFLMVGNSPRSDILPVLRLGGTAVYIPYADTWAHERMDDEVIEHSRYYSIEHLGLLPALIRRLETE